MKTDTMKNRFSSTSCDDNTTRNNSSSSNNKPATQDNSSSGSSSSNSSNSNSSISVLGRYLHVTTADLMNGNFNFSVKRHIGSGYAGNVYKCVVTQSSQSQSQPHTHSGSDNPDGAGFVVALKVLHKDTTKDRVALNEADLLKKASGSHVLKYFTSIECIDAYWIITEYCSKGDLHGMLRHLDNFQVMGRGYMRDVIAGLESLHDKFIVHADIKMKNILISDRNIAKIADFGFARQYSSEDDRECVCHGTRDYWAPEMLQDGQSYNPFLADIYALGVTFVGVCEKRPIKIKYDNIHHIVNKFQDQHQMALFRGLLSNSSERWDLAKAKANIWLNGEEIIYFGSC
ncbi:serine/threonine-protein kinase 4 [Plakobranchus ocellatus]|uniref:Serine/threonine-protein kinase 4 n=1 Tax=Plakobranchus ocellatus TaxID=259542 RepID=A0AAV3YYG3_9GAST|nr:serine/threonine-protein kinase 4 [Plakobranchus ocellatus]